MAVKKESVTFTSLKKEIGGGKFRNIYVLQGEEPYYIDHLQQLIIDSALTEDQRDFNLSLYYGNTANVREVVSACRQYPAFSEYKVVVVREAQLIAKQPGHKNDLDIFASYAEKPLPSTILVICHKGATLKSKPFTDALKANKGAGVIFDSNKVKQGRDLDALITTYANSLGCNIDMKATRMLADHIGTDIARLFSELDKLSIVADSKNITPALIEHNIGISKDFNNFELEDALARRDAAKAFRIVDYYERNPKNNPLAPTIALLYSFFSSVLLAATAADKSQGGIAAALGTSPWRAGKFCDATRQYSTRGLVNIIGYLRECDTSSKGIGSRQDQYALLKELVYKILHS